MPTSRGDKFKIAFFAIAIWIGLHSMLARGFTVDQTPTSPTNITGLWWNPNESGWGAAITQQANVAFVTIFTYDAAHNPTWFVASACAVSGSGCSGDLYRATGGTALTSPWTGSVGAQKVGTITFVFSDTNNSSANFSIDGIGDSKQLTRQIFGHARGIIAPYHITLPLLAGAVGIVKPG
jgi:ribosomal protein S27E